MPEHGKGTPEQWRLLESFLWHDLNDPGDWTRWAARTVPGCAAEASSGAKRLHAALRSLQAVNSGIASDAGESLTTLNQLVAGHRIRPRLDGHGTLRLVPADPVDPVASLLVLALEAVQADAWRRFKLCREPTCRASFFDSSRATTKTWCAMRTCGSRNKMRRYRAGA